MLNTHMTKEREVSLWAIGAPAIGVPLMVALLSLTAPTQETPADEADMGTTSEQVARQTVDDAPGLPADKAKAYRAVIKKMYDTSEWEAVRARNGWVNIHNPGAEFEAFLVDQEKVIKDLMVKLGFLK